MTAVRKDQIEIYVPTWGSLQLESHSNLLSCVRLAVGFTNVITCHVPLNRLREMFKYRFEVPVGGEAEGVCLSSRCLTLRSTCANTCMMVSFIAKDLLTDHLNSSMNLSFPKYFSKYNYC